MFGEESEKSALKEKLPVLRALGVEKVHVAFSGYGDEGSIEEVIFEPELEPGCPFKKDGFENLLYDYLDPARVGDWVNNEGGFGEIEIEVKTGKVTGNINFNETTYTTEPIEDQL